MRPDLETKRPLRVFITGVSGLLGLNAALQLKDHYEVSGAYRSHPVRVDGVRTFQLDLAHGAAVREALAEIAPDIVLHTAGLTNVDACEEQPAEAERQHVEVAEQVALAARAVGACVVHISTDHLGNGTKSFVDEQATVEPLNQYARTKWHGERVVATICPEVLIIRTNFFGWGTPAKASFSDWILDGLRRGKVLPLFVDVHITPILLNGLLDVIEELLRRRASGIFNVAGRDRVSKYEIGLRLARVFGYPVEGLRPVSVRDASLRAPRPPDMSLNVDKVTVCLGCRMPSLDESLTRLKALEAEGWPRALRRAWEQA